ncbi:unnamed protein product [Protopolystoma xenopodis]|uniref:Uncharacterized protein n=1 Tax=Protopolystoma xenopodis TaxID=117903 RepID=A0A3S5CKR3_9PLAT|nr:unnamed protein product [Protopolystoma xenopodis]
MMDESSAHFHSKQGRMSRGLRQLERRIKAKRFQYNVNQRRLSVRSTYGILLHALSYEMTVIISGDSSESSYSLCIYNVYMIQLLVNCLLATL